jgi:ribosomal protein S18 acetylase RimI-like enzyme
MTSVLQLAFKSRALTPDDLPSVVVIDAVLSRHPRADYFARQLDDARADPQRFVQIGIDDEGALAAFAFGRVLDGEFGREQPAVRLEAFGVQLAAQLHGIGSTLATAFEEEALRRGVGEIRTSARWSEHEHLRFLDHCGYRLGGNHVLDRNLANHRAVPRAADASRARVQLGVLQDVDLESIVRIDRRHTGRDRRAFLDRTLREALGDPSLRVSLAARIGGAVAGFLMARLDYGDFGRAEPAALIDTIAVDPQRAGQGIGRSLLSRLLVELREIGIARVETVVPPGNLPLLGLFHDAGFGPSERLSFVKRLAR